MKIAILGAGLVGTALTRLLIKNEATERVAVIDQNGNALNELDQKVKSPKLRTHRIRINKEQAVSSVLNQYDCVISALPSQHNRKITELCISLRKNLVDLGAKDETLEYQLHFNDEARKNGVFIVPGCGMAPGLVNVATLQAMKSFDVVDDIRIYAAGLPVHPTPPFNYWHAFSVKWLIDEYANPTLLMENGEKKYVPSLSGVEKISFDALDNTQEFEAFHIAGQISSLVHHLEGKVKNLSFKTIRYPGHALIFQGLLAMGFGEKRIVDIQTNLTYRELTVRQLNKALPEESEDVVLIRIVVSGNKDGTDTQKTFELVKKYDEADQMSSLMYCTAIPATVAAQMIINGEVDQAGGVFNPEMLFPQERFLQLVADHGLKFEEK